MDFKQGQTIFCIIAFSFLHANINRTMITSIQLYKMVTMKFFITISAFLLTVFSGSAQQAELHINNTSDRTMDIKIMRSGSNGSSSLHSRLTINPQSKGTKYFPTTGYFFSKDQSKSI